MIASPLEIVVPSNTIELTQEGPVIPGPIVPMNCPVSKIVPPVTENSLSIVVSEI